MTALLWISGIVLALLLLAYVALVISFVERKGRRAAMELSPYEPEKLPSDMTLEELREHNTKLYDWNEDRIARCALETEKASPWGPNFLLHFRCPNCGKNSGQEMGRWDFDVSDVRCSECRHRWAYRFTDHKVLPDVGDCG